METNEQLLGTVCATTRDHALFSLSAPVLLMVSGGSDSTALLYLMHALKDELGLGPLRILHVNHMLRGEDSEGDEAFVRELARDFDVPVTVHRVDINAMVVAESGNLENIARRERYAKASVELDAMCLAANVPSDQGRIVVAHTQNDRVETFYMRSIVGTGPGGFASIPYRTGRVVRPLLDLSRDELRAYLIGEHDADVPADAAAQLWREDATNEDIDRFRAFVRHEIVPRASQFNPRLLDTLCNTMNLIGEEDAMLDGWASKEEERLVSREKDGTVSLDVREVSELEVPLRRRVLRRVILKLLPAHVRLDSFHIENIVENGARRGFVASLPATICVRNEYGRLTFRAAEASGERSILYSDGAWLAIPGTLDLGQAGILRAVESVEDIDVHDVPITHAYVDVGSAQRLWVTGIRAGDRMCPLGMDGKSKKISDILVDAKVPKRLRSQLAVVRNGCTDDDDIVWLVGSRMDERYKVSIHTNRVVLMTVEKHEE